MARLDKVTPLNPPTGMNPQEAGGSALVVTVVTVAILLSLTASVLLIASKRYFSCYQAASWQEAIYAAESGIESTLAKLRVPLFSSPTATPATIAGSLQQFLDYLTYPELTTSGNVIELNGRTLNGTLVSSTTCYDGTGRLIKTGSIGRRIQLPSFTINKSGDGSRSLESSVIIESIYVTNATTPATSGTTPATSGTLAKVSGTSVWYRIEATGIVPLAGGAINTSGIQKFDNLLRKLDFRFDHRTTQPVAAPQARRVIEAVVKPVTIGSAALLSNTGINLNNLNVWINSYDSRFPGITAANDGTYSDEFRTYEATVSSNDNPTSKDKPGVINLGSGAEIDGNVATNNVPVEGNTDHITGTTRTDFYQDLPPPPDPSKLWTSFNIYDNATGFSAEGSTAATPRLYKVSGDLKITGSQAIIPPTTGIGYVEIWITGKFSLSGMDELRIPANVHAVIYVDGDLDIGGNGIANPSLNPGNLIIYGNPNPSISQNMRVAGNSIFAGQIYAPYADVEAKGAGGSGELYGSIVADNIKFTGNARLHFDTALADEGPVIGYSVVSWLEDNVLTRPF